MNDKEKVIIKALVERVKQNGSNVCTKEEWEIIRDKFTKVSAEKANYSLKWIEVINPGSIYCGKNGACGVDEKYGRIYINPKTATRRGLTSSEFYDGRIVD